MARQLRDIRHVGDITLGALLRPGHSVRGISTSSAIYQLKDIHHVGDIMLGALLRPGHIVRGISTSSAIYQLKDITLGA